ncbi:enoyl-CoA hydratase/isomerase family protein [Nocardia sp. 2]|uniref:Enoyl-CoA hydratase/isomerase family protein n=1 Tax=Nocardia acididurans TaxID=2802282 RepID=A0ABS1MI14_9NOCA|nr:enoyl-CoA hydratase-related protein [Nocardia acididurans]MBL1079924.1 enoyl-CoA hydratase/isomerase family protein [Nocardia acididurans]
MKVTDVERGGRASGVTARVEGGVAVLTLDRPQRRNAFTREMGRALSTHYRACDADDTIRAIVLTGTPPAFCAGADLSGGDRTFDSPTAPDFTATPVTPAAFDLSKPVIAAVNGHAVGIGLTLALQADIRIMAADATYAVPQVRFGLVPDAMAHWTLPRLAGWSAAAEILLTGRKFNGDRAVQLGLASSALPAEQVLPAALEIAHDIADNVAPASAALCKQLLWATARDNLDPEQVAAAETRLHHRLMGSPDAIEGIRALREGRQPHWSARVSDYRDTTPAAAAAPEATGRRPTSTPGRNP